LFDEFPELKEKRSSFSYSLKFFRDMPEFEKVLKKLRAEKEDVMPLLLFLYKDVT